MVDLYYKVKASGTSPLLMHRFPDETGIALGEGHKPKFVEKAGPREQAEKSAYKDEKTGELYVPMQMVYAAIINAGQFHKIGKKQISTRNTSLVPAGMWIEELVIPLIDEKNKPIKHFEVDSRRAVNENANVAVMVHRPRIDKWFMNFTVRADPEMFPAKLVRMLVDDAGKKMGIGAYRPQRKGPFGRFVVDNWVEQKPS